MVPGEKRQPTADPLWQARARSVTDNRSIELHHIRDPGRLILRGLFPPPPHSPPLPGKTSLKYQAHCARWQLTRQPAKAVRTQVYTGHWLLAQSVASVEGAEAGWEAPLHSALLNEPSVLAQRIGILCVRCLPVQVKESSALDASYSEAPLSGVHRTARSRQFS